MLACTAAPRATTSSGFKINVRFALEQIFHQSAHFRNTRGSADEDDFVNLFGLEPSIFQRLLARPYGAVDDGLNQLLELLSSDLAQIPLSTGQFHIELYRRLRRESDFGFDYGLANGLHGFAISAEIEAEIAESVIEGDGDQQIVDVVAAEMRVAIGGDDFEDSIVQLEDGDVEGTAAEVVDGNDAVLLFVEAVGK